MEQERRPATRIALGIFGMLVLVVAVTVCPSSPQRSGPGWSQILVAAFGAVVVAAGLASSKWRTRLLLLTASSLIGLVIAEIGLRLTVPDDFSTLFRLRSDDLFEYIPAASRDYHRLPINGGQTIRVHIDRQGFRGPELRGSADSSRRVVVFGDSFIAAEYSAEADTYTSQLQRMLGAYFRTPVEVVNAGVTGYGPDQECIRMERDLTRLKPDLVIVSIYTGNDFGDLLRNKLFRLDSGGRLVRNHYRLAGSVRRKFLMARHGPLVLKLFERTVDRLESSRFVPEGDEVPVEGNPASATTTREWMRDREAEYRDYVLGHDDVVTNLLADGYDADVSAAPDGPSARYKVTLMDRVITRMDSVVRSHGIPMLLLIIPTAEDEVPGYVYRVDSSLYPAYQRSNLSAVVEAIGRQDSIPTLNLFPAFRSHDPAALYLRGGNDHWSNAGQRLAASLSVQAIARDGLWRPARAVPLEPGGRTAPHVSSTPSARGDAATHRVSHADDTRPLSPRPKA